MSALHALATRTSSCAVLVATLTLGVRQPTSPKVPFGNNPCASLSSAEQTELKLSTPVTAKPDRAPAKLAADNMCTYTHAGTKLVQVGYMTQMDYTTNNEGNRSKSKQAPADLPGAFYDKQGGLWLSKNGYYAVISGKSELREPVARLIAKKL